MGPFLLLLYRKVSLMIFTLQKMPSFYVWKVASWTLKQGKCNMISQKTMTIRPVFQTACPWCGFVSVIWGEGCNKKNCQFLGKCLSPLFHIRNRFFFFFNLFLIPEFRNPDCFISQKISLVFLFLFRHLHFVLCADPACTYLYKWIIVMLI